MSDANRYSTWGQMERWVEKGKDAFGSRPRVGMAASSWPRVASPVRLDRWRDVIDGAFTAR